MTAPSRPPHARPPASTAARPPAAGGATDGPAPDAAADPAVARVARELARLQEMRGRRFRDVGIEGLVDRMRREARRDTGRLGEIAAAWEATVPAELAARTALEGLRAGTLTVAVDGASSRYRLDRHLRAGGLAALRTASPAPIARVRTTLDPARFRDGDGTPSSTAEVKPS